MNSSKTYFDLFAGIGLVDYALDQNNWELTMAIDYDKKKKNIYANHFVKQKDKYNLVDVYNVAPHDLPLSYLGHASFPCTDVSNAGRRIGVENGRQSSAIDSVLGLLYARKPEERPKVLLTENVKGLLSSNGGDDIRYLLKHYNALGYDNDLLLIDAKYFVPQSRQRIFILSFQPGVLPPDLITDSVAPSWMRPKPVIRTICENLDLEWSFLKNRPEPVPTLTLPDIIDRSDNQYWDAERSNYLFSQMSERHQAWILTRKYNDDYQYATAFRRMRVRDGRKQSTAEIRTDGLAGCLRTAKGGSAKQILIRVGKGAMKVRLLNELECARLMGAPDYNISASISKNDYLFGFGDGVCSSVIQWLDKNYITPIFEARQESVSFGVAEGGNNNNNNNNNNNIIMLKIRKEEVQKAFALWCSEHRDKYTGLPIKGRLYGALVVLSNLKESDAKSVWSYINTQGVTSTDKGTHFGDRSIKGHTSNKIKLALSKLGKPELIPNSGGEAGRTSTGTKRAGLGIIEIVNSFTRRGEDHSSILAIGEQVVDLLNGFVVEQLLKHAEIGGIEISYVQSETIGAYVSKLINYPVSKPGAVLQHLVGAKLEMRYRSQPEINIAHHSSATADLQTNRLGDFDIGNSVIHVTKSPTVDHFQKAYQNAKSGRTVYVLIPENKLGMTAATVDIDSSYKSKVNVYSIEQFITQNIDELSLFRKEISLVSLLDMLKIYNQLVQEYENDNSLKIVLPDFGI